MKYYITHNFHFALWTPDHVNFVQTTYLFYNGRKLFLTCKKYIFKRKKKKPPKGYTGTHLATTNILWFLKWASHQPNWQTLILLSAFHREKCFVSVGHIFRKWGNAQFSPRKASLGHAQNWLDGAIVWRQREVVGGVMNKIILNSKAMSMNVQSHWRQLDFWRNDCSKWLQD